MSLDGPGYHPSCGKDGGVLSLSNQIGLPVSEFIRRTEQRGPSLREKDGDWRSAHGHKKIAVGFCQVSNDTVGLIGIRRNDDFISEQVLHHSYVVNALMRLSVLAHIQPGVGADQLEVCLVDVIETMLIVRLVDPENTEVGKEGDKAECGRRPGNGGGVVLLDASLKKMIGELFCEPCGFDGRCQIAIEDRHGKRSAFSNISCGDVEEGISKGAPVVH